MAQPERTGRPVRHVLLAAARIAVPVAYAAGYYACALYLPTNVAVAVMAALVVGAGGWLAACLRMNDDRRADHLAMHGFVAKVLALPVEALALMVYAGALASSHVSFSASTWLMSLASMYLGVLGSSAFVVAGACEARSAGTLSRGWERALSVCALVPACDVVAAVFLWFAMLRARLVERGD